MSLIGNARGLNRTEEPPPLEIVISLLLSLFYEIALLCKRDAVSERKTIVYSERNIIQTEDGARERETDRVRIKERLEVRRGGEWASWGRRTTRSFGCDKEGTDLDGTGEERAYARRGWYICLRTYSSS